MKKNLMRRVIVTVLVSVLFFTSLPVFFYASASETKVLDTSAGDPIKGISLGNCLRAFDKRNSFCRKSLAVLQNSEKLLKAYDLLYESLGSFTEYINLDGLGLTKADVKTVFDAYFIDSPEHFWVQNKYSVYTRTTTGLAVGLEPYYIGDRTANVTKLAAFDKAVADYLRYTAGQSECERLRNVHDVMCERITTGELNEDVHTAYGALVNENAVCEGYTRALQFISDRLGLDNTIVYGTAKDGDHSWNKVNLDGIWTNIDLTWGAPGDEAFHYYFACTDEFMLKEHAMDPMPFPLPKCTSDKLYKFKSGDIFDKLDVDKIAVLLSKNRAGGNYTCRFIYTGSENMITWMNANGRALLQKLDLHGSYGFSYKAIANEYHFTVFTHNHQFGDWSETTAPKCTKEGVLTRSCSVCGAKETRAVRENGHSFGAAVLDTSSDKACFIRKCTVCGGGEKYDVISGIAGFSISWTLGTDGVLHISGKGAIPSYKTLADAPWYPYRSYVKAVEIKSGLTAIGANAFGGCTSLKDVYYYETSDAWSTITILGGNDPLSAAALYCVGEEPQKPEKPVEKVEIEMENVKDVGMCVLVPTERVTAEQLMASLGEKTVLTDPKGRLLSGDDFVGTGSRAKVTESGKSTEYTVIVRGDADGDGKITYDDLIYAVKASTGLVTLKPAYGKAADFNGNGKVTLSDTRDMIKQSVKRAAKSK